MDLPKSLATLDSGCKALGRRAWIGAQDLVFIGEDPLDHLGGRQAQQVIGFSKQALKLPPYFYNSIIMETKHAVAALAALAQDSRLDVFRLLVQAGAPGLPAGQVGERLGIPAATLSFHLSQLKNAGLVHVRRDGRSLIYAANYDGMNALMGFLTENCCAGDAAACAAPICNPATATVSRKGAKR